MSKASLFWLVLSKKPVISLDIAVIRSSGELQGFDFDGADWVTDGNPVTVPVIGTPEQGITGLSASTVAYCSGETGVDTLRKYEFDGDGWAMVGNEFSVALDRPAIAALSTSRVALLDKTAGLRTYEFDGSDWAQTGNALAGVATGESSLAALSATRVVRWDVGSLQAYDFDGTDWAPVGASGSAGGSDGRGCVAAMTGARVVYLDTSQKRLKVFDFDGSAWTEIGNYLALGGVLSNVSIGVISEDSIVFTDINLGVMQGYQFDGTNWATLGNSLAGVNCAEGGNTIATMAYRAFE